MEFDVNKESVCINKLICKKKELVFVEEDMIVPDSKPDILKVINLSGNVCIYKKEIMDGKIKIDGCVNTYIMYLPDSKEEILRSLNATIEFSQTIAIPDCKESMDVDLNISIKDLECKILNERKINVRAGLDFKIKIYSNENIEVITELTNINDIQTLTKEINTNSLIGKNSTRVYLKETLKVSAEDEIAEILKAEVNLINNDIKISYNKVLSKFEANVRIMYLTEDNKIKTIEENIPAVGFIDMQNITEDNICDIKNEIINMTIKPNSSEEHSIYVEIEIESNCIAYEKLQISLIQDLYSPSVNLVYTQKKISTTTDKIIVNKDFTVTSKTNIQDLTEENLLDVDMKYALNKEQITNSKIIFEGDVIVNFIYMINNSINSKISKIPFEFSIDNSMDTENININTDLIIKNKKIVAKTNGDIDCNIDFENISEISKNSNINIIENINTSEDNRNSGDYDSLIIYIVQKGDTLWKIAKRFRSTVEDIARVNGIEDENRIQVGQKIYIPKFKYVSKRENINEISA